MPVVTVHLILYILAFFCFCLNAAGVPQGKVNLLPVGLALLTLAAMIGARGAVPP